MSALSPITSSSSYGATHSPSINLTDAKVQKVAGHKRKLSERRKPKEFTFSATHLANHNSNRMIKEPFGLDTLSAYLNRQATPDELLNFQMDRKLRAKIDEKDPEIPVGYLINRNLLKELLKLDLKANFPLTEPVCWEALKNHLKTEPTPRQYLNCVLQCTSADLNHPDYKKLDVAPFYLINLQKNRDMLTRPTQEEVAAFFQSKPCWQDHCSVINLKDRRQEISFADLKNYLERDPTSVEIFNWIENRDLNAPITQGEIDRHDWRAQVNRCLGIDLEPTGERDLQQRKGIHWPVSLENLRKQYPDANWLNHFNCNRGKRLNAPVPDQEIYTYLDANKISYFQGWTNFALDREASHPLRDEDLDHCFWRIVVKGCLKLPHHAPVLKTDFESVIHRNVTDYEYINCLVDRRLSERVSEEEMEVYLNRPLTLTEKSNCRNQKPLSLGQTLLLNKDNQ